MRQEKNPCGGQGFGGGGGVQAGTDSRLGLERERKEEARIECRRRRREKQERGGGGGGPFLSPPPSWRTKERRPKARSEEEEEEEPAACISRS